LIVSLPRRLCAIPLIATLAASVAVADAPAGKHDAAIDSIKVAFTPGDRIDRLIIAEIDASRSELPVPAYSVTNRSIARGLVRALKRGVLVQVIADREQAGVMLQNVLANFTIAAQRSNPENVAVLAHRENWARLKLNTALWAEPPRAQAVTAKAGST
jgi:hypothetical protein